MTHPVRSPQWYKAHGVRPASATRPKAMIDPMAPDTFSGQWVNVCTNSRVARATHAAHCVAVVQQRAQQCVWIGASSAQPYAPDLKDAGVLLEDLVWLDVPDTNSALEAALVLMRHRAATLLVVDVDDWSQHTQPVHPQAWAKLQFWARQSNISGVIFSQMAWCHDAWRLDARRDCHGSLISRWSKGQRQFEQRYDDVHRLRFRTQL